MVNTLSALNFPLLLNDTQTLQSSCTNHFMLMFYCLLPKAIYPKCSCCIFVLLLYSCPVVCSFMLAFTFLFVSFWRSCPALPLWFWPVKLCYLMYWNLFLLFRVTESQWWNIMIECWAPTVSQKTVEPVMKCRYSGLSVIHVSDQSIQLHVWNLAQQWWRLKKRSCSNDAKMLLSVCQASRWW